MAEIKTFNQIKLLAGFADEDDRTLTLDNPNTSLDLGTAIGQLESLAADVLIGDKYGAPFTRFKEAKILQGTRTELTPNANP